MELKEKKVLIGALIGVGILFVFASVFLAGRQKDKSIQEIRIGEIRRETGKVILFNVNTGERQLIDSKSDLLNLQTVETLETGSAIVRLSDGTEVKLEPNFLASFELDPQANEASITLAKGDFQFLKKGSQFKVFVLSQGQKILADQYHQMGLDEKSPSKELDSSAETPKSISEVTDPAKSLTQEEIQTELIRQKSSFYKCYTQLLNQDPMARGRAILNFVVKRNGKLENISIQSQELKNNEFQNCLTAVVKRISFRSFEGSEVATLFPLNFE